MTQQQIPMEGEGVAPLKIDEIETAAQKYVDVRDRRMELTKQEVVLKTNLIQTVMENVDKLPKNANGDRVYHFDEQVVIFKQGKPSVKVRVDHGDAGDEDEDEE